MSLLKIPNDDVVEKYANLLKTSGENGIFRHAVAEAVIRSIHTVNPELEILDAAESFFTLYRRTGEENYFTIGRVLRRAAHKVYREFLRMNNKKTINMRFLNMVK
jgi:hypothetical protein